MDRYVVLDEADGEMTLLAPEQFYTLAPDGRELHEFVRYTVSEEGALVKQEVVRRFFEGPTAQPRLS